MVHQDQQTGRQPFLTSLPAPQNQSHVTKDQGPLRECEGQTGMPGSLRNLYCHH